MQYQSHNFWLDPSSKEQQPVDPEQLVVTLKTVLQQVKVCDLAEKNRY